MIPLDFYKKLFTLTLILCGSVLIAQPANDNCSGAIEIPIAANLESCTPINGTTVGADPDDQASNPSEVCSGSWYRDDVWYKFNTGTFVDGTIIADVNFSNRENAGIAFYTSCGPDAEFINCESNNEGGILSIPTSVLSPNQDIWIRVWSTGHATDNSADFTICLYGSDELLFPELDVLWGDNGEGEFSGGMTAWTRDNFIDTCGWEYWPNNYDNRGAFGAAFLFSPTSNTGTAVFNSDYMDNDGDPDNQGRGRCPASQSGSLISPVIDLTGLEQEYLAISFYQAYRHNNSDTSSGTFVDYTFDNGATWLGGRINRGIESNDGLTSTRTQINIPFEQSQGQSSIQIRFRTELRYYYWIIDDVALVRGDCMDLLAPASNFYAGPPNFQTPISQVQEVAFIADISNLGSCDMDNVRLDVSITEDATNSEVYRATENYGTVRSGVNVENQVFPDVFTMPEVVGAYTAKYEIYNGEIEADTTNNSASFIFEVSKSTFSKERSGNPGIANYAASNWPDGVRTSWGFGNSFYVKNGAGYIMENLEIGIMGDADSQGDEYEILLFKIEDDGDGSFSQDERTVIAQSSYSIVGDEGSIIAPFILDADDGSDEVMLEDNTRYMAWVQHNDPDRELGINLTFDSEFEYDAMDLAFDTIASRANDQNLNRYGSYQLINNEDLTGAMTSVGTSRFGVPIIRMNIKCIDPSICSVGTNDPLPENNKITLFPNPSTNEINLKFDLTQDEDYARVNIVDITGKTIKSFELNNIQDQIETFDIGDISVGSYLMQYIAESGTRSLKFIKY